MASTDTPDLLLLDLFLYGHLRSKNYPTNSALLEDLHQKGLSEGVIESFLIRGNFKSFREIQKLRIFCCGSYLCLELREADSKMGPCNFRKC